jgi:hypothetical protein
MSGKPEQIDSKGCLYFAKSKRVRKLLKMLNARYERRKAKKDPEEGATYNKFKGWEL